MTNSLTNLSDIAFRKFTETPLDEILSKNQSSNTKEKALAFFKRCAIEVPAYQAFLAERNVNQ
jgi:phenylacetate-CoA ligase